MSFTRKGRLYRVLERLGIPTPLLKVTGDTFTATDDQITSVSVSHGGTDPSPGISPSTCEAVIQQPQWIKTGETFNVELTDAAALELARFTGGSTANIQQRFTGRAGRQTNTDDKGRLTARIAAASWSAHLGRIRTDYYLDAGMSVHHALSFLCTSASIPQITWSQFGETDVLAETITEATFSNTAASLSSDIGTLVRDTRAGVLEAWSLPYRRDWVNARLGDRYPLTRSQAISPAEWDQPQEKLPAKVRADWIAANGTPYARSAGGTADSIVEAYDWTHIKAQTAALDMRFEALHAQNWGRRFHIPSITVDLLYLLSSGVEYHRGQAGMLLMLNAGDPIGLSGDWQTSVRGVHFVTGIDEKITGSEWTLTLSLVPYTMVLGLDTPDVPAMVWDSATYPWNAETRIWNH